MYPYAGSSLGPYGQYGNLGLYGALVAYGTLNLTDASPAQSFTEPVTVTEAKAACAIPDGYGAHDEEIAGLIVAARVQAEILQNRDLVRKQWDLSLDYWNNVRIQLRAPLV